MASDFTFVYVAEPPEYQFMAATLLASIRTHFPASVRAIGYCGEHKMAELHPGVLRAHELMDAEIRPMKTQGIWDAPYPHGNKILAALEPRDTEYSAFVDSDVLFLKPNVPATLAAATQVTCSRAASLIWAGDEIWDDIYGAFNLPVPEERIHLMRRSAQPRVPYFSAGLVGFPEADGPGGRFADVWFDTARRVDRIEGLERRRPYLDQMSLPVAIQRAGLTWRELPEEQHYILGGKLRGKPLPDDMDIHTVHYRNMDILKEVGLLQMSRAMMKAQTGARFVRRLADAA